MYRVMIIDDEKSLRNLLKASIDWESMDLEIVGEAASGIEAINTIDKLRPHIVFVDIRMPFMDGIEFSRIALERYPNLKVCVLTAYDEFEYARKCIGMGVFDYLLKPIVREDIKNTLKKAIDELDKQVDIIDDEEDDFTKDSDMKRVMDYISNNYSEPSINLTSIAKEFGYNSSYLSRRFKEVLGVKISDYLTKCRMEKALECIKENKLMYVTAKEVGIPDPNYFGKCFKKYTGKSYSDMLKE